MAIKMVREPSETPNINNIDDIIPMRYAYGNQNGYVIGKGTEISNTVNGLNFTVNSGRLVLQGVECDIDASGATITIDNIATKRYYVVYLQVNLGLNTAQILSTYDTATYPTIDSGDDLTENTTGVARLPLYRFTATSGIISEVNKVVESVKYAKDIKIDNAVNAVNAINAIINNDETYSGFTRNSDNIIQDGQNLLMSLKPIYVNKSGFLYNIPAESKSLTQTITEYTLDPTKLYMIVGSSFELETHAIFLFGPNSLGAYRSQSIIGRLNSDGTINESIVYVLIQNENNINLTINLEGTIKTGWRVYVFGIYELTTPIKNLQYIGE